MVEENGQANKLEPPESDWRDFAYSAMRAGLSLVPVAGGAAVELLQFVLQPSLEKRRMEWMKMVSDAIIELREKRGIPFEELQANEVFIDTVIQATHIAYRNSQEEKRQALKNAIVNSALPIAPEQSIQQIFLNWVDTFTVWHLRLLSLFNDPIQWGKERNNQSPQLYAGGPDSILESAYPELVVQRAFYDNIWRDLFQKGAVGGDSLHVLMSGRGILEKRTTDLGEQFLRYIQK